ncbi:MAG: hypothetical protein ABIO85_03095 [Sphingomicrobium sp.]
MEAPTIPEVGSHLTMTRGPLTAHGKVIRTEGNRFAVLFNENIQSDEWLKPVLSAVKSSPFASLPLKPKTHPINANKCMTNPDSIEKVLNPRIAEELAFVARMLRNTSEVLSKEPGMLSRYSKELQSFDLCDQILMQLADILKSDQPSAAALETSLTSLRLRLLRRPSAL